MPDADPISERSFVHRVALVSLIATSIALAAATAVYLHRLVLWFVLGFVLTELFSCMATALHRRLPGKRGIWVAASLLIVLGLAGGTFALVSVPLVHQGAELAKRIPRVVERATKLIQKVTHDAQAPGTPARNGNDAKPDAAKPTEPKSPDAAATTRAPGTPRPGTPSSAGPKSPRGEPTPTPVETAQELAQGAATQAKVTTPIREAVTERLPGFAATTIPILLDGLDGAFDVLGVIFFAAFVAAAPDEHRRGLLRLTPTRLQPKVDQFIDEAGSSLRKWLGAVGVSMAIVGTVMTGALFVLGVRSWLVFGLVFAAMELLPYAGPFVGALGPILECVLDREPGKAVLVAVVFIVVQLAMTNLVTPYLVRWRTEIPGSLALAAILGMGAAAGALGVLVAVPLLAIVLAAGRVFTPQEPVVIAGGVSP